MARRADGITSGTYYLLDMGKTKYGECIVCKFGNIRILIDGGHRGDLNGQPGFRSIPAQLAQILGGAQFHFDLLVVTHAHDDHIGCLPELVAQGIVTAEWALVTDEKWGFGREGTPQDAADFGLDDADPETRGLVAALFEEDHSDMPADELRQFIQDAATVESRYVAMLKRLEHDGSKIIRHQRDAVPKAFIDKFKATGLTILGPSKAQLRLCNKTLAAQVKKATQAARGQRARDATVDLVALYRQLIDRQSSADAADMAGTAGPPRNNQSIVLAFGGKKDRVLLGGDMQLAKAEVSGMDAEMKKLRAGVKAAGPYAFVKTLHHTSYNGQNEDILKEWGSPKLFAHSGGKHDASHPDKGTLELLKEQRDSMDFARTDRNGMVVVTANGFGKLERGALDDFSINRAQDEEEGRGMRIWRGTGERGDVQVIIANLPFAPARLSVNGTQIDFEPLVAVSTTAVPSSDPPRPLPAQPALPAADSKLAGGRNLPALLFVTEPRRLSKNVGAAEAARAMAMIEGAGQKLLRLNSTGDSVAAVRAALRSNAQTKGVVLVGGYDVVRALRLDVLTPQMRQQLGSDATQEDGDDFIVWSDDAYADRDGSGFPDIPVSRIPDGRDPVLLMRGLGAVPSKSNGKYGIRNSARAFADKVWADMPGKETLNKSGPFVTNNVVAAHLKRSRLYFMLHGSDSDGRSFIGEQPGADSSGADSVALQDIVYLTAIRADQIPEGLEGVALAGCCWGALTVDEIASANGHGTPTPRIAEASIALSLLKSGLLAFIGCTGSHYSPDANGAAFGGPMHRHFWASHAGGMPPAQALLDAKNRFLASMPHGQTDPFDRAIERKILFEFTCLGLGW